MTKKLFKMIKLCAVLLILLDPVQLSAEKLNVSFGAMIGIAPDVGGNLHSSQLEDIGVYNGVDDINRSADGKSTAKINKLLGSSIGFHLNTIIADYFLIYAGLQGTMSIWGGSGQTIDNDPAENLVNVKYSIWMIDLPLAFGLSIPFFHDGRISIAGGLDFMYVSMSNSIKSDVENIESNFSGWAFPLVVIVSGEYFISKNTVLTTTLMYYRGETDILRDDHDYANVDVSGYRIALGVSYYFDYKVKFRQKDPVILEKL